MLETFETKIKEYVYEFCRDKKRMIKLLVIIIILFLALAVKIHDNNSKNVSVEMPEETESAKIELCVDISGEVNNPGVYTTADGTRLYEIIEKAGGLTEDADTDNINRAKYIEDGEKIVIPAKNSTEMIQENNNGLININTATKEELMELPGVGDAIADRIIEYRSTTQFKTIEDIMCVSGIGNATFEKMKSKISV